MAAEQLSREELEARLVGRRIVRIEWPDPLDMVNDETVDPGIVLHLDDGSAVSLWSHDYLGDPYIVTFAGRLVQWGEVDYL